MRYLYVFTLACAFLKSMTKAKISLYELSLPSPHSNSLNVCFWLSFVTLPHFNHSPRGIHKGNKTSYMSFPDVISSIVNDTQRHSWSSSPVSFLFLIRVQPHLALLFAGQSNSIFLRAIRSPNRWGYIEKFNQQRFITSTELKPRMLCEVRWNLSRDNMFQFKCLKGYCVKEKLSLSERHLGIDRNWANQQAPGRHILTQQN